MGFNITGMAFDANYKNNIVGLERQLGLKLGQKQRTTFEDISQNWWEKENAIGVAFSPSGTLIFCHPDIIQDHAASPDGNSLCFAMIDTSDAYALVHAKDGEVLRDVKEVNGRLISNDGKPSDFETHNNMVDNIWSGIETIIGQSFAKFPPEQISYIFEVLKEDDFSKLRTSTSRRPNPEEKTESIKTIRSKSDPSTKAKKPPSLVKQILGRVFGSKPSRPISQKEKPSDEDISETVRRALIQYPKREENFIDQILALCQEENNVEQAFLAIEPNSETARHEYILGLKFNDADESKVKKMARTIKDKYFTDRELFYASNLTNPELFESIQSRYIPFYKHHEYFGFRELLVKWAIDRHAYEKKIQTTIRSSPIVMLATIKDGYPNDDQIILPKDGTYFVILNDETDTQPFIPIFTDLPAAIESKYYKGSDNLSFIEISIPDFNTATRSVYKGKNFILNPTSSPTEFFFQL